MSKVAIIFVCGICWTLAYVLAIRRGFKDRTYGFPAAAVLLNVAWEFVYAFIYPGSSPVGSVAMVWLILDLFLLFQVFTYWKSEHPELSRTIQPVAAIGGGLFASVGIFIWGEINGVWILASAFGQNLLMSLLFVIMLYLRDDARGQSVYIGILKCIGTGVVVVPLLMAPATRSMVKKAVYAGIVLFDMIYIVGLYIKIQRQGISPLRRL